MTPRIARLVAALPTCSIGITPEHFYWFDIGEGTCPAKAIEFPDYPSPPPAPFAKVAVVSEDFYGLCALFFFERGSSVEWHMWFVSQEARYMGFMTVNGHELVHNGLDMPEGYNNWPDVDDDAALEKVAERVKRIFTFLASTAVTGYARAPSPKNPSRISKGKKPLFEWRTVVIEPKTPKQEPKGGTHATPRLHDRRGHLRTYRSGKQAWVRPCKVGKASQGVIFHDYEVRMN